MQSPKIGIFQRIIVRLLKWGVALTFSAACVLMLTIAVLGIILQNRAIALPPVVTAQTTQYLDKRIDVFRLRAGMMQISLSGGFSPVIGLRDVKLLDPQNNEIVTIASIDLVFDPWLLASGVVQAKEIYAAGSVFNVTRNRDGVFDFSMQMQTESLSVGGLTALIAQIERAFETAPLRDIERVQVDQVTLEYDDFVTGKRWIFDGGRFIATNDADGLGVRSDLSLLSGGGSLATLSFSFDQTVTGSGVFKVAFDNLNATDLASQASFLRWLSLLDAPISGSLNAPYEDGAFGKMNASFDLGQGRILPFAQRPPLEFSLAKAYFGFDPSVSVLDIYTISFISNWGDFVTFGRAKLEQFDTFGLPQSMSVNLDIDAASLNPATSFVEPLDFSDVEIAAKIDFDPFKVNVSHLVGQIEQSRFDSTIEASYGTGKNWIYDLNFSLDQMAASRLPYLWPVGLFPQGRAWFSKMKDGSYHNLDYSFQNVSKGAEQQRLDFNFEQLHIPVTSSTLLMDAAGAAQLLDQTFDVSLSKGAFQADDGTFLDLSGSKLHLPDIANTVLPAKFNIKAQGDVDTALSILSNFSKVPKDDFQILENADEGFANLAVDLAFNLGETLQAGDVLYDVRGYLTELEIPEIYKDQKLNVPQLYIEVDNNKTKVRGEIRIGELSLDVLFEKKNNTPLEQLNAKLDISPAVIAALFPSLSVKFLEGNTAADLELTFAEGQPVAFTLVSDLLGLALDIPLIDWQKPQDEPAKFTMEGTLGREFSISQVKLEATDLAFEAEVNLDEAGELTRIALQNTSVENWFKGDVILDFDAELKLTQMQIQDADLDIRKGELAKIIEARSKSALGQVWPRIQAQFKRLKFTDIFSLSKAQLDINGGAAPAGTFSGLVNGGAAIAGTIDTREKAVQITITAQDAGRVLMDAQVLKDANAGDIELTLDILDQSITGQLLVKETRVKNAPVLVELLSRLSFIGIIEQLDGNGLFFTEIVSDFQLKDAVVTLKSFSASGPSIGLSLNGIIDTKNARLDLQGVFSPFFMVNILGSFLTRPGEGLYGITFDVTGDLNKPNVSANPLSVFTPGFLRELFRRPMPSVSE